MNRDGPFGFPLPLSGGPLGETAASRVDEGTVAEEAV